MVAKSNIVINPTTFDNIRLIVVAEGSNQILGPMLYTHLNNQSEVRAVYNALTISNITEEIKTLGLFTSFIIYFRIFCFLYIYCF